MDLNEFQSMGGKARAAKLSKERLSEIGREAAKARWGKVWIKTVNGRGVVMEGAKVERRCQAAHCLKVGRETEVHGLKAYLCEEHAK